MGHLWDIYGTSYSLPQLVYILNQDVLLSFMQCIVCRQEPRISCVGFCEKTGIVRPEGLPGTVVRQSENFAKQLRACCAGTKLREKTVSKGF
jgi:hypothetical protein